MNWIWDNREKIWMCFIGNKTYYTCDYYRFPGVLNIDEARQAPLIEQVKNIEEELGEPCMPIRIDSTQYIEKAMDEIGLKTIIGREIWK